MTITVEELRRRGIALTPEEAVALFEHVLRSLPEVGPVGQPAGELADWEVEELRAGGFDVSPVRPDEPNPRAHGGALCGPARPESDARPGGPAAGG